MARNEIIQLIDDLNGSSGKDVKTVQFGLDGATYEIDLDDSNETRLRGILAEYISGGEHGTGARFVGGRNLRRRHEAAEPVHAKAQQANDAGLIREWAQANGIELASRGRIPSHVAEAYREAQRAAKPKAAARSASARKASAPRATGKTAARGRVRKK